MMTKLHHATREYLRLLPLHYDADAANCWGSKIWKTVPRCLKVRRVNFAQTRVFHEAQPDVLSDYWIEYEDGTADPISFTEAQLRPKVGEFYCRLTAAMGGGYVVWKVTNKLDQNGSIQQPYKSYRKREPKPKAKCASKAPTPKEVLRLQVVLAEAKRANDDAGVAEVEQAIRDFYEVRNRKADIKDRKDRTL